jgi:SAM-dependent methyltransferase
MALDVAIRRHPRLRALVRGVRRWSAPVADPVMVARGIAGYGWFFADWRRYARLSGKDRLRLTDAYPQLHDRTSTSPIDPHYFYSNGWAMRRIVAGRPRLHVDVASQSMFANLLGAVLPVVFVDYRPLEARIDGLQPIGGSLYELPFRDGSLTSLSCLHVLDNVGLGRYGDPIDPRGVERSVDEMARTLAPNGHLYLSVPIGRPRVCFNAHRIHRPEAIPSMNREFELSEFSVITDEGVFVERARMADFDKAEYACGLYLLRKRGRERS